jgi:superfamily II DNA helicase RecQ
MLPTGAGKSILFILPAMLTEGRTSVVIMLFVALIKDLIDRAQLLRVDIIRFNPAGNMEREIMLRAARLVVVSTDVTSSVLLQMYVDGLYGSGLLQRIFIDECHTIITDAGYRVKLAGLVGVRQYECPIIMLTATLLVLFEGWFQQEMLAVDARLIRDRTTKANCRYHMDKVKHEPGAVEVRVVEVV